MSKYIDYSNLKVNCPYEVKNIKSLKIVEEVNNHSTLLMVCYTDEKYMENIMNNQNAKDKIEIKYSLDNKSFMDLFKGVMSEIKVKCIRGVFYLSIEAKSHTHELDIKKNTRVFQDNTMLYKDLVYDIIREYKGSDFIDNVFMSNKTEKLIIQYEETDWEFLKRIASHFNKSLIVDSSSTNPKFIVGHANNNPIITKTNTQCLVGNYMKKFDELKQNDKEGFSEQDFVYNVFIDDNYWRVGQRVNINNKVMIIKKVISEIENGVMNFKYEAVSEKAMQANKIFNEKLIGKSINGKVIEVNKDEVKVDFEIDKTVSKDKSMWFKYSTLYSVEGECGWYFMPEEDDMVSIYFPNNNEESAIATAFMRKDASDNNKINDPSIKRIGTNKNKELIVNKSEIKFNAKEGMSIKASDSGIEVCSTGAINFDSKNNLVIKGSSINITANETVHFINGKSNLIMDGSTHTRGGNVKVL